MRIGRIGSVSFAVLLLTAVSAFAGTPKVRRGPTSTRAVKERTAPKPKVAQNISPERATEIQTALIKAGYLSGAPSGSWDTTTQSAMEKLQADNGWQTKLVPDARAIIKLGLGPNAATSGNSVLASSPAEYPESQTPSKHEEAPVAASNR